MSISLAFSSGKPCCNKKTSKKAVSCKFNHTVIEADKNAVEELIGETKYGPQTSFKCNADTGNQCAKSANQPWWKFWAKKSSKDCLCKKSDAAQPANAE